eukprot:g7911.t1
MTDVTNPAAAGREQLLRFFAKNGADSDPGNNIIPAIPELCEHILFPSSDSSGAHNSRLLDAVLSAILGGPDYMLHAHRRCHVSSPGGAPQSWHKDTYKGRLYQPNHAPTEWVMAMYYPQRTTVEMGPTELWPGTHFYRGDYGVDCATQGQKHWRVDPAKRKTLVCEKGTIVLIHYDIWHRAGRNTNAPGSMAPARFMFKLQFARMSFSSAAGRSSQEVLEEEVTPGVNALLQRVVAAQTPDSGGQGTQLQLEPPVPVPPQMLHPEESVRQYPTVVKSLVEQPFPVKDFDINSSPSDDNTIEVRRFRGQSVKAAALELASRGEFSKHQLKELQAAMRQAVQEGLEWKETARAAAENVPVWSHLLAMCGCSSQQETDRLVLDSSDLEQLEKLLFSVQENKRLYAAYLLAKHFRGDTIESETGLDRLLRVLQEPRTTTPQRRCIVYGMISGIQAEPESGGYLVAELAQIVMDSLGSQSETVQESRSLVQNAAATDDLNVSTTQVRRNHEGFDFEFSKEATDKQEELVYCALFVLANSAWRLNTYLDYYLESEDAIVVQFEVVVRLLVSAAAGTALKPGTAHRSLPYSSRCVAAEGLGRCLAANLHEGASFEELSPEESFGGRVFDFSSEEQSSTSASAVSESAIQLREQLRASSLAALTELLLETSSPCEDLRCAAALAIARAGTAAPLPESVLEALRTAAETDTCRLAALALVAYSWSSLVATTNSCTTLTPPFFAHARELEDEQTESRQLASPDGGVEGRVVEPEDRDSPLVCSLAVGDLQPEWFHNLGEWQKRYGRDSTSLSKHFYEEVFLEKLAPVFGQALLYCPCAVLEVLMNGVLHVDLAYSAELARLYLKFIFAVRDKVVDGLVLGAGAGGGGQEDGAEEVKSRTTADVNWEAAPSLALFSVGAPSAASGEKSSAAAAAQPEFPPQLLDDLSPEEDAIMRKLWPYPVTIAADDDNMLSRQDRRYQLLNLKRLMVEWYDDIAYVYPKLFSVNGERLGPPRGSSLCFGQKFYVYDTLHPSLYTPSRLSCLQGQWGTEVLMKSFLENSDCRTKDPEEADWFYVPLYATCRYVKLNEGVVDEAAVMSKPIVEKNQAYFCWCLSLSLRLRGRWFSDRV